LPVLTSILPIQGRRGFPHPQNVGLMGESIST
jgi:hypothetical protein